ncbi:MAG TPA: IclR family transcriptional regulator, partial [Vicinamibacterales bacterium]|nr:IclR family transcriptional regulator [Vicinamibacterales bacterium]
ARYKVDAAAKALELLSVFSFREPRLSLADLAARTGIPRATAFRLLSTLEQSGFLAKDHGAYQLGIKCFVLGNIVAGGLDLRETAHPHLVALRDSTRETTQIAILDHWQVVYLERMISPYPVGFMRSRAGAILPAYCTALGKTLLAYTPEADVDAWAATQKFPALTPRTITSARRLLKELRVIRERGYAIDEEERERGVRCVAAPIRNHHGDVVAAVSIAGPIDRLPRELAGSDIASAVVATARAISIDLGAVEDYGPADSYRAATPAHGGRR